MLIDSNQFDKKNCVFKERFQGKYIQFESVKFYNKTHKTGCLAFNKHGKGRRITRSKCTHKSTLFLERNSKIIIDIQKNNKLKSKLFSLLRNDSFS